MCSRCSSKDTFVKFWDLDTQHCFKTLVGHKTEVWDFVIIKNDTRLITGSGDNELRIWLIDHSPQVSLLHLITLLARWIGLSFIFRLLVQLFLFKPLHKESVPKKKRKIEKSNDLNSSEEEMSESDDQGDEDDENVSLYFQFVHLVLN